MFSREIKRHPARVALALIIVTLLPVLSAASDEADAEFKSGKALLKQKRAVAAYLAFEKATNLDPSSSRYRRALEESRNPALDEAVRLAPQAAAKDFSALVALATICRKIQPEDPRTAEVDRVLLKTRSDIETGILQAMGKAVSGDIVGARGLLKPYEPYRSHFPSIPKVEEEIAFRESLYLAQQSALGGDFRLGLEAIGKALALRPNDPDALTTQDRVVNGIVNKARPIIAEKSSSEFLGDLALAVVLLNEVEKLCAPCQGRVADAAQLRDEFQKRTMSFLDMVGKTKSRPAAWATCAAAAEARAVLGGDSRALLDRYCPEPAKVAGLSIGLSVRAPEECSVQGLQLSVEAGLPSNSVVVPMTAGGQGTVLQQIDLAVSIEIERCGTVRLGESEVKPKTSSYFSGVQQLANPEFVQLESQLRSAQIEQARLQRLVAANPNDYGSSIALAVTGVRVGTLSKRLRETSPYTESRVEAPYMYEEFQAGAAGFLEGEIAFSDPTDSGFSSSAPLSARYEIWKPGVRGVFPQDARGLRNQEPSLPAQELLRQSALGDLGTQVQKRIHELVPVWLAAKASVALSSKQPFDALGYLTLLRLIEVPTNDPDLAKYKEQYLTTQLLGASQLEAHRLPLKALEARLRKSSHVAGVSAKRSSKDAGFLEKALKAVVVVRRGEYVGTGFLVSSSGLILTNNHVIEASGRIVVETSEGEEFLASTISQSAEKDLALIQISASQLPYLQLASEEEAHIGDEIYALGNPQGLQGTVTKGIISAKRRLGGMRFVQIDAPINPGNSGGPLLRADGQVVGINTMKIRDAEGLNFAIAIDEAKTLFAGTLNR